MYTLIYTHKHADIKKYTYSYMYVYMCVYICMYICTYIYISM